MIEIIKNPDIPRKKRCRSLIGCMCIQLYKHAKGEQMFVVFVFIVCLLQQQKKEKIKG